MLAGVVVLVLDALNRNPGHWCDSLDVYRSVDRHWQLKSAAQFTHRALLLGVALLLPWGSLLTARSVKRWLLFVPTLPLIAWLWFMWPAWAAILEHPSRGLEFLGFAPVLSYLVLRELLFSTLSPFGACYCLEPLAWFERYLVRSAQVAMLLLAVLVVLSVIGGGFIKICARGRALLRARYR